MDVTLISRYFDTRSKGIGSYAESLYKSLINENINVKTITQEDSFLNINASRWSYYYYTTISLKRLIKREFENTDIFHSLSPMESFYVPRNKSVITIHDFIPIMNKNNSLGAYIIGKYYEKSVESAIKCEQIIVTTSELKEYLISNLSVESSKVTIIPPIIDENYCNVEKDNDSFVIGTVSELSVRKRVNILIESFLEANIENSKLLIGGNGPELENLKKISKKDKRIKFLGFIPDEKMNDFYNSLDVFVFPTINEGYGMPIVEAMACKKPVITLDDANIPSTIKQKTYVCKKEELSDVLYYKKYSCDLKNNFKFYKEHSSEIISKKLIKVYESI